MRKILILAIVLIVSACSKSDDSSGNSTSIFGKWELYSIAEDGYDEIDGLVALPTFEFIAPDTYREIDYPYEGDDDGSFDDYIGTFTLVGDILTLKTTYLNGNPFSVSPDVFIDVVISKNTLEWGDRYDDGYDSGYLKYRLRRVN